MANKQIDFLKISKINIQTKKPKEKGTENRQETSRKATSNGQ